jgi:hypothetical protein
MSPADNAAILQTIQNDPLYAKYMKDIDPASAYEKMDDIKQNEDAMKAEEKQASLDHKLEEKKAAAEQKAQLKSEEKVSKETTRIAKKLQNKAENELINIGIRSAKSLLKGFLK